MKDVLLNLEMVPIYLRLTSIFFEVMRATLIYCSNFTSNFSIKQESLTGRVQQLTHILIFSLLFFLVFKKFLVLIILY